MEEAHVWSDELDLGDEALDREHHLQIALAGALADAIERGRPWMASRLVEQLAGYTAEHFRGEELLMEAGDPARLAAHRQEHQTLLAQIDEVRSLLGTGETDLALPMTLDLLSGVASHIAAFDKQYAEHARTGRADRAATAKR